MTYYCDSYVKSRENDELQFAMRLWKMNTDGNGKTLLTEFDLSDTNVYDMCLEDDGNILILCTKGDLDAGGGYVIYKYSPAGELIKEHDLAALLPNAYPMDIDYSGGICFLTDVGIVCALDIDGGSGLLYSVKLGDSVLGICFLKDRRPVLSSWDENKPYLN